MLDAFLEKRNVVLEVLNRLLTMADELGSSSSRDRIHKHIIEKLEKNIFHLVIVGEFNHGKTTFVNALLGKQVFAVGVTPTTAVIHEIGYGKEPWAQVTYESGMRQELRFDEVKYFAIGHPAPVPDPGPVRLLEIRYPAEILRNHVALVDTRGVNDLSLARAEITYDYIPRSDAVLFLLDEILHGTNSRERHVGARSILRMLIDNGAMGAVSTHDLALASLADELPDRVRLVHLQEQVVDDKMIFDYLLRDGVVKSGNALRWMRFVGLRVDEP
mgnify:CR=1 FL=1